MTNDAAISVLLERLGNSHSLLALGFAEEEAPPPLRILGRVRALEQAIIAAPLDATTRQRALARLAALQESALPAGR